MAARAPALAARARAGGSGGAGLAAGPGLGRVEWFGAVGIVEVGEAVAVVVTQVRALGQCLDLVEILAVRHVDLHAALADPDDVAVLAGRGARGNGRAEKGEADRK